MKFSKKVALSILTSAVLLGNTTPLNWQVFKNSQITYAAETLSNENTADGSQYGDNDSVTIIVKLKEKAVNPNSLTNQEGREARQKETKPIREKALSKISAAGIDYNKLLEYDLLFNGFSLETSYKNAKKIQALDFVESVELNVEYIKPEVPALGLTDENNEDNVSSVDSNEIIKINPVWNSGYKGEGMVVSIIDSGLDADHDVFNISNMETAKYKNKEQMESKLKELNINYGGWVSDKVIYAYNYNDQNNEIKENSKTSHGTHVAGISVGNPKNPIETGEKVVGVAPEAQLIFMRVFSDTRGKGTSSYIYAKAIEDSVKLGADSINLSLGSTTGNVLEVGNAIKQAISMAKSAGIVVSIAAGNDNSFGDSYSNPNAKNPDYGLVGNPSVALDSLSVAAFNNNVIISDAVNVLNTLNNSKTKVQISTPSYDFPSGELEYVEAGLGNVADFKNPDSFKGKIALVKRGAISFAQKAINAKNAGAIGIIIYNHEEGGDSTIGMNLTGAPKDFPVTSIGNTDGKNLITNIATHRLLFDGSLLKKEHDHKNELTSFTSWGLSSDGELKPDVTAPGGSIYSSVNDGKYANMNGTSMASPHVAGAVALVKQSLEARYKDLKGDDLQNRIKLLIMSTATPHFNTSENAYTSPRQQGAGIVNTAKAISSSLYVTNAKNGYGSVTLGNVEEDFSFTVEVHNLAEEAKELTYVTEVTTDKVNEDGKFALLPKFVASIPGSKITIPAKSSVKVPITVNTSAYTAELSKTMPNGYYLEGFVRFIDPIDSAEAVSIPYVGFKGAFENLEVLEKPIYEFDLEKEAPFYYYAKGTNKKNPEQHFTYIKTQEVAYDFYSMPKNVQSAGYKVTANKILGEFKDYKTGKNYLDKTKMAISPNGDNSYDKIELNTVFLRNAQNVQMIVKNASGDVVYSSPIRSSVTKNYFAGKGPQSQVVAAWDGTDGRRNKLPDGKYNLELNYRSETPGANQQSISYPITIDRVAPEFTGGKYDAESRKFTPHKIKEEGSGIQYHALVYNDFAYDTNGNIVEENGKYKMNPIFVDANDDGTFTIPEGMDYTDFDYYAIDWAGNENDTTLKRQVQEFSSNGLVDVKFMVDGYESDLKNYISRYVIKNSKGEVLSPETRQIPIGLDSTGNPIMRTKYYLPLGETYTVELVLVDTDAVTLTSPKEFTFTLDENNASQTVIFTATEKQIQKLTVVFDEVLPKNSKVYAIDKNNVKTEIPQSNYVKTIHEKDLELGDYTIVVELEDGYAIDRNNIAYTMVIGSNIVKFDIDKEANKVKLTELVKTAENINLEEKTPASADVLTATLNSAKAALNNPKVSQEQVDIVAKALADALENLVDNEAAPTNPVPEFNMDKLPIIYALEEAARVDTNKKTNDTVTALLKAVEEANKVVADNNASSKDIETALNNLREALDNLKDKEKANTDKLISTLLSMVNVNLEKQTPANAEKFRKALADSEKLLLDKEASQNDVDKLEKALKELKELLVEDSFTNKNITVIFDKPISFANSLFAETITDNNVIEQVKQLINNDKALFSIYELHMNKDDAEVKVEGSRTVRAILNEYNDKNLKVYHLNDNGQLTEFASSYNNGVLEFKTDHFSKFVFVASDKEENSNPANPGNPNPNPPLRDVLGQGAGGHNPGGQDGQGGNSGNGGKGGSLPKTGVTTTASTLLATGLLVAAFALRKRKNK